MVIIGIDVDEEIMKTYNDRYLEDVRDTMGGDIIKYIDDYLYKMDIVDFDDMMALYLSSIGGETLNLLNQACMQHPLPGSPFCPYGGTRYNRAREDGCARINLGSISPNFLYRFGETVDMRVNTMHISPSGFSKNFFINLFMNRKTGFISGIGIPNTKVQSPTESGYIGNIVTQNNVPTTRFGLAKKYCSGIIAVPEYSYISNLRNSSHSAGMENDILEILDGGVFNRSMAAGDFHFYSYHTLWGATQPGTRFNLAVGMGRRLNFINTIPDQAMEERYKHAQLKAYTDTIDQGVLLMIRGYLYKIWTTQNVAKVEFGQEYVDWKVGKEKLKHTEYNLFDNVAAGYNFVLNYVQGSPPILKVEMDNRLRHLLERLYRSRMFLLNASNLEWGMFDELLPSTPLSIYDATRLVQSRQYLSWADGLKRLKMAVEEGYYGSFVVENGNGAKIPVVYKRQEYKSSEDAQTAFHHPQK